MDGGTLIFWSMVGIWLEYDWNSETVPNKSWPLYLEVSWNRGGPKWSIYRWISPVDHPAIGVSPMEEAPILLMEYDWTNMEEDIKLVNNRNDISSGIWLEYDSNSEFTAWNNGI